MSLPSRASFMLNRATIVVRFLLIVTIVCAHEISGTVLGKGGRDAIHATWSSQPVNNINTRRTLHRKITNVMTVRKVDLDDKDKRHVENKNGTDRPYVQKLHNVPSGPNPIGNFDPAQINILNAPSPH